MDRHVLVVDDNGGIRDVVVSMLVDNGFIATEATDGVAMRDLLAADQTRFDVIVLDWLMPGEQGAALALHAKDKGIPVVMISGDIQHMKFAEDNGLQLLRKPFRMAELIQAIENAIASGQYGQRDA